MKNQKQNLLISFLLFVLAISPTLFINCSQAKPQLFPDEPSNSEILYNVATRGARDTASFAWDWLLKPTLKTFKENPLSSIAVITTALFLYNRRLHNQFTEINNRYQNPLKDNHQNILRFLALALPSLDLVGNNTAVGNSIAINNLAQLIHSPTPIAALQTQYGNIAYSDNGHQTPWAAQLMPRLKDIAERLYSNKSYALALYYEQVTKDFETVKFIQKFGLPFQDKTYGQIPGYRWKDIVDNKSLELLSAQLEFIKTMVSKHPDFAAADKEYKRLKQKQAADLAEQRRKQDKKQANK